MSVQVTKFRKNLQLTHKQIVDKRASLIEEDATVAIRKIKQDYEDELRILKRKQADLEDLYPDTTMSLNPVKGEFDGDKWVTALVTVKREIRELQELISDIVEVEKEYFTTIEDDE